MDLTKKWRAKSIKLQDIGIAIAPEIFVATERIYLPSGRVVLSGTKYFTWATAQEIVMNGYAPRGWRLPTAEDGVNISRHYNRRGIGILVLGLDGFISPSDMIAYSYSPSMNRRLVANAGKEGLYWTSELKSQLYPYVISNNGIRIRADTSVYITYGLPILLVKDI